MKRELHKISVREVIVGYKDSAEEGVVAYSGKLDISPKYQREFVYKEKQRNAVIETGKSPNPTVDMLEKLAKAIGVPVAELFK